MKKRRFRLPLRVQITLLLTFFVVAVAIVSFVSTFSVFESDKMGSVQEIQTLQVADLSREMNDRFTRARSQLRETAVRLLDPGRGQATVEEGVWSWVTIRGKEWRDSHFKDSIPSFDGAYELTSDSQFTIQDDKSDSAYVLFVEPIRVLEGGRDIVLAARGRILRSAAFGDSARLNRGPIRGVLIEISTSNAQNIKTEADVMSKILSGEEESQKKFAAFFKSLSEHEKTTFMQPSQPISRKFLNQDTGASQVLMSWATVPLQNSKMQVVVAAFTDLDSILAGFRRTKAELMFWSILLLGFGMMASVMLGGRVSKPIENMVQATRVLETGDFSVRVPVERNDEIGDLAAAFNHMGEALDEREKELESAQNALIQNEKMAALGTLSAGIAHEVKNPLAGILGHADMTVQQVKNLDSALQPSLLKHLETIQKETKRCRGIIDNLMRFSRKEDSSEKAKADPLDLEIVAWEAVMLVEHPLNMAKVRIEKEFDSNAKMILGNANQIEQVLLNMLQNAGHAMPEGGTVRVATQLFQNPAESKGGEFQAYVHPEFHGAFMRISVTDSGIGMSPEVMKKVFEPFFTTKPRGVGTGLGLSVTMSILADHKARVSITSAPGKGTTFFLDFMVSGDRSPAIHAELEEIRHKKSGGQKLASDVGAATAAVSKVEIGIGGSVSVNISPAVSGVEKTQSAMQASVLGSPSVVGEMPKRRPEQERSLGAQAIKSSANSAQTSGSKFTLRKPQVKKT